MNIDPIKTSKILLVDDLQSVLEDTIRPLKERARQKGLRLIWEIDEHVPLHLLGDSRRLQQILLNLIENGVKFTETGKVVVSVTPETIEDGLATLEFSILDTGIGIEAECLDKIFESFTQADGSSSRKYGGSGLGTTIAKQLVELMGGRIWVESEVGRGSVFRFSVGFKIARDITAGKKTISTHGTQPNSTDGPL